MKVKELKEIIKDLPDEMLVGLMDTTTDDFTEANYPIEKDDLLIEDYVKEEGGEIEGKMLFITFENWLNENPISSNSSKNNNTLGIADVSSSATHEKIKDIVLKENEKGNIVVATFDGLKHVPLKEFVKQPAEGMLYDLNRDQVTILMFIENPKWVNDYAVMRVIQELKRQLENKTC